MTTLDRFMIVELDTDAGMRMSSEKEISDRFDMADTIDGRFEVWYFEDNLDSDQVDTANFVKNTGDDENSIILGWSDLVLRNSKKVVGTVIHTDH